MATPDPWYFLEIPRLPPNAPSEQARSHGVLTAFLTSVARSGGPEIPASLKSAMAAYLRRWHPRVHIPDADA